VQQSHVATIFFDLRGSAEFEDRATPRFHGVHPVGDFSGDEFFDVKL
jgi:hypothetical protein